MYIAQTTGLYHTFIYNITSAQLDLVGSLKRLKCESDEKMEPWFKNTASNLQAKQKVPGETSDLRNEVVYHTYAADTHLNMSAMFKDQVKAPANNSTYLLDFPKTFKVHRSTW